MNFGGPILKDKLFFFLDYEGFRQTLKPLYVLHAADAERDQRNPGRAGEESADRGHVPERARAIPASAINPLSAQIHQLLQAVHEHVAASLASAPPVSTPTTTPRKFPSPITPTRAICASTISSRRLPPGSCASATARRRGSTIRSFRCRSTAQTTARSAFSISRSRSATRTCSAPTRCSTRGSASPAPRPANSLCPSARTPSRSLACRPCPPVVAGGLPQVSITDFTTFGRQSTNPQWQDPALLDPKVNFTWVKGKHSLKFGYEYEHIWMAVNDNNPLYGSLTYGGGYSATTSTKVADNYWADFLFGLTSSYQLANYFVVHLRQTLDSVYAQDDWKVLPNLTLNLGLRWEYGSPYSEQTQLHFQLRSGLADRADHRSGAVAGNGITPVSPGGVYGKTLVNPDCKDFLPRIGFAYAVTPKTAIRGGFGTGYVHYTRAGSGDIQASTRRRRSSPRLSSPRRVPRTTATRCRRRSSQSDRRRRAATSLPIRDSRRAWSPHSIRPPTTSPGFRRTRQTATSRTTSSACSGSWRRTPCSTWPMSATTDCICRAF